MNGSMTKDRDSYFDNLKGALITLVVIGHFLLPMEQTRFVGSMFWAIYLFHMPMFVMISGYFAKGIFRDGHFRADKVLRMIWLYILFELVVYVTENLAAGTLFQEPIDLFYEGGAPWYLLSMIWWYVSIPFVTAFKPRTAMALVTVTALLAGYSKSLGDGLAMSRTLTFAPFFYGGYFLKKEQVQNFLKNRNKWAFVILAFGIFLAVAVGCKTWLGPYCGIAYGMNYARMGEELYAWGPILRGGHFLLVLVVILGLMALMPAGKLPWTKLGQRTLQIYMLHRPIRDLMEYWGFYQRFTPQYRKTVVFVVILAVAVTFILGNPWIETGFKWIQAVPDKWFGAAWNRREDERGRGEATK